MNSERGVTDLEQILKLKDEVLERWRLLPAEHQASLALVLIEAVMGSELGEWLRETILLRWPQHTDTGARLFPITAVSRDDLGEAGFSDREIAQLTDEDMKAIARQMEDHYVNDWFWDELEYLAEDVLEKKQKQ